MKKLLVLMLVLGMGSLASAGLMIDVPAEVNVGDTITIGIASDDGLQYDAYLKIEDTALASVGADRINAIAVPAAAITAYGNGVMAGWWAFKIENSDTSITVLLTPGIGFEFDVLAVGEGTLAIELMNASAQTIGTASVNIVPEPISMVLLGLGGLFLRRRK